MREQAGLRHCGQQQEKSGEISNKVTGCGHAAENLVDTPSENLDGTSGTDGTNGANETNENGYD